MVHDHSTLVREGGGAAATVSQPRSPRADPTRAPGRLQLPAECVPPPACLPGWRGRVLSTSPCASWCGGGRAAAAAGGRVQARWRRPPRTPPPALPTTTGERRADERGQSGARADRRLRPIGRPALLCALGAWPAAAGLVRPLGPRPRRRPVFSLWRVQHRLLCGAACLSVSHRTVFRSRTPKPGLVGRPRDSGRPDRPDRACRPQGAGGGGPARGR